MCGAAQASVTMHTMRLDDARELLRQSHFGILSLAHERDTYGLPLFYGYDGRAVYFHTLPGAKVRYIASTREACFTVSIVRSFDEWASVHVFGQLERVDGAPHELAGMQALLAVPLPPEFGFTPRGEPKRAEQGVAYRLNIVRITGRFSDRRPAVGQDDIATRGT